MTFKRWVGLEIASGLLLVVVWAVFDGAPWVVVGASPLGVAGVIVAGVVLLVVHALVVRPRYARPARGRVTPVPSAAKPPP